MPTGATKDGHGGWYSKAGQVRMAELPHSNDPAPAADAIMCGAIHPLRRFACTRVEGHAPMHEAAITRERVIAVWSDDLERSAS